MALIERGNDGWEVTASLWRGAKCRLGVPGELRHALSSGGRRRYPVGTPRVNENFRADSRFNNLTKITSSRTVLTLAYTPTPSQHNTTQHNLPQALRLTSNFPKFLT